MKKTKSSYRIVPRTPPGALWFWRRKITRVCSVGFVNSEYGYGSVTELPEISGTGKNHTLDDRRWAYLLLIGSYHNMRPIGPANGVDTSYWGLLVKANRFRSPASQKCWPANRLSPSSWRPITRDDIYWSYIPRHILSTNTLPYFGKEAYYVWW